MVAKVEGEFCPQPGRTPPTTPPRESFFHARSKALEDRTVLSTLTVVNNLDHGAGSLRAVLASANNGDTIRFAKSVHNIGLTSGELTIGKSVDIEGPGTGQLSISGTNSGRVFETAVGTNVTLSDLTITQGRAADQGGGVLNDGGNLTLSGDNLTGNVAYQSAAASADGGALDSLGGTLIITDCARSPAIRPWAPGARPHREMGMAAALKSTPAAPTISNSTISGNVARGGNNSVYGLAEGGGVFTAAPTSITDSAVNNNVARAGDNTSTSNLLTSFALGGGLFINGSSASISTAAP